MFRIAIAAISMAAAAAGCTAATATPTAGSQPPADCAGNVVTIPWGGSTDCDVNPPQQLDWRFTATYVDDPALIADLHRECDDAGGQFETDPVNVEYVCTDIDY